MRKSCNLTKTQEYSIVDMFLSEGVGEGCSY